MQKATENSIDKIADYSIDKIADYSIEKISAAAAILSLTEIGLGSLLHSFKVPFSGHFLSLNQALILGKSQLAIKTQQHARFAPSQISLVSSLLKSLSPSGKKLTPMLAISAQGFLFNVGTIIFGINPLGIWVGTVLLALWGFIQPIGIYMLLFGENLVYMAKYFLKKFSVFTALTADDIWTVLLIIIAIKITLATVVTALIFLLDKEHYYQWQMKLLKKSEDKRKSIEHQFEPTGLKVASKKALKDLLNPLFIFTWILTGTFFYFAKSAYAPTIWVFCRPLIIGYLLFLGIRLLPFDQVYKYLDRLGFNNFSKILQSSIDKLKKL